jgi:hypothetical protein
MGIRDEELSRLIRYAKGLNVEVRFKDYVPYSNDAGFAATDGSEVTIAVHPTDSKIYTILTLIHELGHVLECIHTHNRRPNEKLDAALDDEEKKKNRKIIYEFEKASALWWETIYKETDLKFPINKLFATREFDVWQYKYYYENGKFPNRKVRMKKKKELENKYASKETT